MEKKQKKIKKSRNNPVSQQSNRQKSVSLDTVLLHFFFFFFLVSTRDSPYQLFSLIFFPIFVFFVTRGENGFSLPTFFFKGDQVRKTEDHLTNFCCF